MLIHLSSNHETDYICRIEYTCSADCSRGILVYVYVSTKWKNDVDFVGGKMTDGLMYQPSLCYTDSTIEQKSEEDCKDQAHYTALHQLMFNTPDDIRLIDINMPETNLSVRSST